VILLIEIAFKIVIGQQTDRHGSKVTYMIISLLHLKVSPTERMNVLSTIHSILGPTSAKSGCLGCGFYSRTQNDDELLLLEKWESKKDLESHIRSDEFQKVLAAMETAIEPPEINFHTITSTEGLELVKKILA
jgi:quinol monooxygenase YgiN